MPDDYFWAGSINIDLYAVVARWLIAYGSIEEPPQGSSFEDIVKALRKSMREGDRVEHQCLLAAANATTKYVGEQIFTQLQTLQLNSTSERRHDA
jgi:hypothetical protein